MIWDALSSSRATLVKDKKSWEIIIYTFSTLAKTITAMFTANLRLPFSFVSHAVVGAVYMGALVG
jgi:hypothetical protein